MHKKVDIVIDDKTHYAGSVKEGRQYTSVGCTGSSYGSANPCDTPEQIESAIEHCRKLIISSGDKPVLKDIRDKATLRAWF